MKTWLVNLHHDGSLRSINQIYTDPDRQYWANHYGASVIVKELSKNQAVINAKQIHWEQTRPTVMAVAV